MYGSDEISKWWRTSSFCATLLWCFTTIFIVYFGSSYNFFYPNIGNFSLYLNHSLLVWINLIWFCELLDQSLCKTNVNFKIICSTNFVCCGSHCSVSYRAFKISCRYLLDFMDWGFNRPIFLIMYINHRKNNNEN
jgi:hypothetical protein